MFCPNCGRPVPDDSAFCPECGSPLKAASASNDRAFEPESRADNGFGTPASAYNQDPWNNSGQSAPEWGSGDSYSYGGGYGLNRLQSGLKGIGSSTLFLIMTAAMSGSALFTIIGSAAGSGALGATGILTGLVSAVPAILIVIGLWLLWLSCRREGTELSGIGLCRAGCIVYAVLMGIAIVITIILAIFLGVGGGALFSQLAPYLESYTDAFSGGYGYMGSAILGIIVVLLIIVAAVMVLMMIYYILAAKAFKTAKLSMLEGRPAGNVSVFLNVMNVIIVIFTIIGLFGVIAASSAASALSGYSAYGYTYTVTPMASMGMSVVTLICSVVSTICAIIVISRTRKLFRENGNY